MAKLNSSKTHIFRRFQPKRIADSNSAYFFTYFSTGQQLFSIFSDYDIFLTLESLNTLQNKGFESLGLCQNDFSKRTASDCIYQTRSRYRETQYLIFRRCVQWLCIMAMYHGYVSRLCITAMYHGYVSWLCILYNI